MSWIDHLLTTLVNLWRIQISNTAFCDRTALLWSTPLPCSIQTASCNLMGNKNDPTKLADDCWCVITVPINISAVLQSVKYLHIKYFIVTINNSHRDLWGLLLLPYYLQFSSRMLLRVCALNTFSYMKISTIGREWINISSHTQTTLIQPDTLFSDYVIE